MSHRAPGRRPWRRPRLTWLLPALFPIGAGVWFLLEDAATRRSLVERVPEGAAQRAAQAGLGFCVLVGLAWIVLPAAYHGHRISRRGLEWCLGRRVGPRILLIPAIAALALVRGVFGFLFALDAIAVIVTFPGTLLLGAWIVAPGLFGGREAILGLFGA